MPPMNVPQMPRMCRCISGRCARADQRAMSPPSVREPDECERVEREHHGECKPQSAGIVPAKALARYLRDDANAPLRDKAAGEHEQVERGVRARGELLG